MNLKGFQVQQYKCVLNSSWIDVEPLTALVGKNESGKTTLLKALHKLNPYNPERYEINKEWPRGARDIRDESQVVCTAEFALTSEEMNDLEELTDQDAVPLTVKVTRNYAGELETIFPEPIFPETVHPNDIDEICASLPELNEPTTPNLRKQANECIEEVKRLAAEGRFSELAELEEAHAELLNTNRITDGTQPQTQNEQQFIDEYLSKLSQIATHLENAPSIREKAHEYIVDHMPIFIYMADYRAFTGNARLDQVQQRVRSEKPSEEDKTLLMILKLSGLNLDEEVSKGKTDNRRERILDIDDASATLTSTISRRWKQNRYRVRFEADGQEFYTFVQGQDDPALIELEERSKGFQWFFSFDLLFMHESQGTFKNCVLLLDEPGLHLHPAGQEDLLNRLEAYAEDNTLIYSSHLPFMIDLHHPERLRILSETDSGTQVSDKLVGSQPEAKLVLQAALGMSGRSSWLVAEKNLIVEGVDDYWIITELSNLLENSGEEHLLDDVLITPAGGASEAAYIATLMIGQELDVVVLVDTDRSGNEARDVLVKKWLTSYNASISQVLSLGEVVSKTGKEFSIEDLFTESYYKDKVQDMYEEQLTRAGVKEIELVGEGQLVKRVERTLKNYDIVFNHGSVAKLIRKDLKRMPDASELSKTTKDKAIKLFKAINSILE